MRRARNTKIVATLGPASSDDATLGALFERGVDVFRFNFSHGTHEDHARRLRAVRALEARYGRPIGVLLDLQGPKLRVGQLAGGKALLENGAAFRLDMDPTPGDATRAPLPHPEIFAALREGTELLLDDGKLRLRVERHGADFAETRVLTGGVLSDRKGVNVPSVVLPLSPLTPKDREDLAFGLELGVDWVALSFVQRPEDIEEARAIIGKRAWIMAKIEKPAAMERLDAIVDLCDGLMVARGDLGVELPPEHVPEMQRRIVQACRRTGKPVVVATQMLESMISSPSPTRAEVSDVANAVYEGVDAVMLSAESASGRFPVEAVAMMDRIINRVENSPSYRAGIEAAHQPAQATTADAVCASLREVAALLHPAATITYTASGFSALRAARERPDVPLLSLTPSLDTARRLAMAWGVHAVRVDDDVHHVGEMLQRAGQAAQTEGFAGPGDHIAVVAGLPFGHAGSTNLLHVHRLTPC
ncbi:pyruvate kinase [Ramlibacter solisilvae]|uniref:Pyruvate kinase n=1 Tax=Ramlibacter tataouinensis TaxID=94132 RepID=A0A127JTC9_9BURK|nr:pyruvate kinase [Ramlibacter tataouinensis]AMO23204.1 pyruvate kinase [Ramlibacter tataouinensis]